MASQPKAHQEKVKLARALRTQTAMTRDWIAKRLGMGSSSYVAHLLRKGVTHDGAQLIWTILLR